MLKRKKVVLILLTLAMGYALALLSTFIDRGLIKKPGDCIEITPQCMGYFGYGWPFVSFIGYKTFGQTRIGYFLLNWLFWSLIILGLVLLFFRVRKKLRTSKSSKPEKSAEEVKTESLQKRSTSV